MPIFRVKSVKIYTGQKKFTRAAPHLAPRGAKKEEAF